MSRYVFCIALFTTSLCAFAEESELRNYVCMSEVSGLPKDVTIDFMEDEVVGSSTWFTYYQGVLIDTRVDTKKERTSRRMHTQTVVAKDSTTPLYPEKLEVINVRPFSGWISEEYEGGIEKKPILGVMHYRLIAEKEIGGISIKTVGERMIIHQIADEPKRIVEDEKIFMLDAKNRPLLLAVHSQDQGWQWVCEIE